MDDGRGPEPTALVAATHHEIARVARRHRLVRRGRHYEPTGPDRRIRAVVTGVGRRRASEAVHALLRDHAIDHLIHLGFAGGLAPGLRVGQTPRIRWITDAAGSVFEINDGQVRRTDATCSPPQTLLTVDHVVRTRGAKRRLFESHRASLVDMESIAVASIAAESNVRFTAVRAVSDAAEDELPEQAPGWVKPDGRTNLPAVARDVLRHPQLALRLRCLKRNGDRAAAALVERIEALIA